MHDGLSGGESGDRYSDIAQKIADGGPEQPDPDRNHRAHEAGQHGILESPCRTTVGRQQQQGRWRAEKRLETPAARSENIIVYHGNGQVKENQNGPEVINA
nr:hypothetical protein [uncultured Rhodopila sp.]